MMKAIGKNISTWIISVFLLIIGIEIYVYSLNPVFGGDEASYCYVLDWEHNGEGLGYGIGEDLTRIESIGDVISSQADHYMHWGGRSLVHAIEQFFSGVSSPGVFYVVNTFVFLLTLSLTVLMAVGKDKLKYLAPWLIAAFGMLYGLNWSLYILTSINLACNYLWPMCGLLIVMMLWYHVRANGRKYNIITCLGLLLISFIAGWSHEAYCLGLSGAFFLYYLFNLKEFRGPQAWIASGYCLGTLVLLLSPGNFYRLGQGEGKSLMDWIVEFVLALPRLKLAYVFLLTLLYFKIKRKNDLKAFWEQYKVLTMAWILSLTFICFVHTVSQSFTGIELMSLLLTLCLLRPIFTGKHNLLCSFLMLLICVHIGIVSVYQFNQNKTEREAIQRYACSEDGLALNYTTECGNPFVSYWLRHVMDNFRRYPLTEKLYADNPNPMILITPQDEQILKHPKQYFIDANRFGSGPFYAIEGCSKVWAPVDSCLLSQSYQWHFDKPKFYEQMSMRDRVMSIINPSAVSMVMPTAHPEIISTRYGNFIIIDIPTQRKIIGISHKDN